VNRYVSVEVPFDDWDCVRKTLSEERYKSEARAEHADFERKVRTGNLSKLKRGFVYPTSPFQLYSAPTPQQRHHSSVDKRIRRSYRQQSIQRLRLCLERANSHLPQSPTGTASRPGSQQGCTRSLVSSLTQPIEIEGRNRTIPFREDASGIPHFDREERLRSRAGAVL
jgi:hypothetical protein